MTAPSQSSVDASIRANLEAYFSDLNGGVPNNVYAMVLAVVEKPLLEVVMRHVGNNQSKAAQYLGINRNTLRKKLLEHGLAE
jgi:Fis family transcriptional regulator